MSKPEIIAGLLTIFIVIAVFFVAAVRAADAESRGSQTTWVLTILVLAALLPAWGTFFFLFVNSFNSSSRDFWAAVTYMVAVVTYFAEIPFLIATGIAALVYMFSNGEHPARLKRMVITLAVTVAIAIGYLALIIAGNKWN